MGGAGACRFVTREGGLLYVRKAFEGVLDGGAVKCLQLWARRRPRFRGLVEELVRFALTLCYHLGGVLHLVGVALGKRCLS